MPVTLRYVTWRDVTLCYVTTCQQQMMKINAPQMVLDYNWLINQTIRPNGCRCEPIKPTAEVFFTHTHVLHKYKIPYTFSTLSPDSHSLALSLHPPICFSIGLMRGSDKSSHMQMPREHDSLLIILCGTTPDKNGDPAPFA